jgi:integrase
MLIDNVESYLKLRRALGFKLYHAGSLLRRFAHFASTRGEQHVHCQTAIDWAIRAPSLGGRDRRLKTVILFARHAHSEDRRHEIPPDGVFGYQRQRRLPFILSPEDVNSILKQAKCLGPPRSLRPHTYYTLFALLSATGLRISEALNLRLDDVTTEGLLIRRTKFRKNRLVPLHETVQSGIDRYLVHRLHLGTGDDHLFVSLRGNGFCYETVRSVFNRLVQKAGVRSGPDRRDPHIHGFRHTFAVRALESCTRNRNRVDQHMLALSTYMGHAHLADTYWYLQTTPQMLTDMTTAWTDFVKGAAR